MRDFDRERETELCKICLSRTNFDVRRRTGRSGQPVFTCSNLERTNGVLVDEETHYTELHGPVITNTRCVTPQKSGDVTYTATEASNLAVYIPLCRSLEYVTENCY